jgi:hypothetical protein
MKFIKMCRDVKCVELSNLILLVVIIARIKIKNLIRFVLLKIFPINGVLKTQVFIRVISSSNQRKEDLLITSLVDRVKKDSIEEVIIATSATVEGQTTAHYIKNSLKETKTKVSKLAQGLPVGGEIESLDDGTLFSAFKNRS